MQGSDESPSSHLLDEGLSVDMQSCINQSSSCINQSIIVKMPPSRSGCLSQTDSAPGVVVKIAISQSDPTLYSPFSTPHHSLPPSGPTTTAPLSTWRHAMLWWQRRVVSSLLTLTWHDRCCGTGSQAAPAVTLHTRRAAPRVAAWAYTAATVARRHHHYSTSSLQQQEGLLTAAPYGTAVAACMLLQQGRLLLLLLLSQHLSAAAAATWWCYSDQERQQLKLPLTLLHLLLLLWCLLSVAGWAASCSKATPVQLRW